MITRNAVWRGVVALGTTAPMAAGQCPDQWRLLVTQASPSAAGFLALDAATGTRVGAGPTGYTPAGIAVRADRDVLVWVQNSGPALLHDGGDYRDLGEFIVQGAGGGIQGRELIIDGNDIYVAGGTSDQIAVFDAATGAYGGSLFPAGTGGVNICWGLAVRETDVLVASAMTDEVLRYDRATGEFLGAFVIAGSGGLDEPYDVVVGPTGDVFVSSRSQGLIYRYSATGEFLKLFGLVGEGLRGLAFDHRGDLLACSWNGPFGSGLYRFDGASGEFYGLVANVVGPMFVAVQPPAPPCRPDLDCTGELDFFDFLVFQFMFTTGDPRADFDGSGSLDFFDFLEFQREFAAGCQ